MMFRKEDEADMVV